MVLAKDNMVYYYIAFEKNWNPFSFIDQKDYKRKLQWFNSNDRKTH